MSGAPRTASTPERGASPTAGQGPSLPAAYAVLGVAQVAIGAAALLARLGLGAGLSPAGLAAWRLGLAAAVAVALGAIRGRRGRGPIPRRAALRLAGAGVLLGVHFAAWFASLDRIPVARSTLLVATTPLWAGLAGALLLRQRLGAAFWVGLVIAAVGLCVFTGLASAPSARPSGDLLAVLGAVAIAAYLLLVQGDQQALGTGRVVAWTYTLAALTMALAALAAGRVGGLAPRSPAAWGAIVGMAAGPQLVGHTALNWSLRHFPAGVVGAATLLEPVVAAALAWWLLGEPIGARQAIGGAILLGGVALALRQSTSRA